MSVRNDANEWSAGLAQFSGLGRKLSVSEIFQFYPEISTVTLGSQGFEKKGTSKGPYRSRLTSSGNMMRSAPSASGKSINWKIEIQKFQFQKKIQKNRFLSSIITIFLEFPFSSQWFVFLVKIADSFNK